MAAEEYVDIDNELASFHAPINSEKVDLRT